jgi:hypothetical protein
MKIKKKMSVSSYTQQELTTLGKVASEMFEDRVKNLISCFDATQVYNAMAALVRLNGLTDELKENFTVSTLCRATCENFLTLLSRGALDTFLRFPITQIAQEELDKLAAEFGHGQTSVPDATGDSSSDTTPAPTAEELLAKQVVQDWNSLPAADIRKKRTNIPGYAAAVENAVAAGHI